MSSELRKVLASNALKPLWDVYAEISWLNWRELMLVGIEAGMDARAEARYLEICRPYLERMHDLTVSDCAQGLERFLGALLCGARRVPFPDNAHDRRDEQYEKIRMTVEMDGFLGLDCVVRTGWTRVIPKFSGGLGSGVESVALHSVKTAFLAGLMHPEAFGWAFLMGLVHDHAELVIGDLTPGQVRDRAEKTARECRAYEEMLGQSGLALNIITRLRVAFFECMEDMSRAAHCVHIADKLDMAMQALLYEQQTGICLEEFLDSSESVFRVYANGAI